ncbi:MAG: helix-turn-helix domain-containing protein [Phycisphaeraceae bacterium]|nr:helix-turn-helix domain-containing protein [Phycisphaeraceae bacterium]
MAKIFYTLEEAALKLKMSETQVKELVSSGQLQEFRDRDRLMFKVDQVNLLAQGDSGSDESGVIPLAESAELGAISLASDSGSGMNLESPKEQTGISIFDADQTDEADPSAVTQVTESAPTELSLETVGSGSGLLDLTREADDTSLGRDLLEEVSAQEGSTASETVSEGDSAAGELFEPSAAESDVAVAAAASGGGLMVLAEQVDGKWSGLAGGFALGMVALLALTMSVVIFGMTGAADFGLIKMIGDNFMMWLGIAAGVVILPGLLGLVMGRRG